MTAERPAEALRSGHIGLASARERVEALGGRFELSGRAGRRHADPGRACPGGRGPRQAA